MGHCRRYRDQETTDHLAAEIADPSRLWDRTRPMPCGLALTLPCPSLPLRPLPVAVTCHVADVLVRRLCGEDRGDQSPSEVRVAIIGNVDRSVTPE